MSGLMCLRQDDCIVRSWHEAEVSRTLARHRRLLESQPHAMNAARFLPLTFFRPASGWLASPNR
jgi:hypothetical protein